MSFIENKRIERLEYLVKLSKSYFGKKRLEKILSRDNDLKVEFNQYLEYCI